MASPKRYLWEYGTTETGNYIGKSGDKLGFYGTTPAAQQSTAATATDLATALTLVNAIKTALDTLGLMA
jgi:hypothetical protein